MQHERPPVTIRDPARPVAPAHLPDEQPRSRSWLPVAALLVTLVLVGWSSLVNQRTQQRDRDEQARLDTVVALSLTDRVAFAESRGQAVSSRSLLVNLDVEVRNDGPREVRVERAGIGDFRFLGELQLDPGQMGTLQLVRTATCAPGGVVPRLDERPDGLALQVDTLSGLRNVILQPDPQALERLTSSTRRTCGFLPVNEAVTSASGPAVYLDDGFIAPLEIVNASVRPLRLTAVQVAPGLAVELRTESSASVSLPSYLAPSGLGQAPSVTRYELRGRVECDRLDADAERDLGRVVVEVDDGVTGPATSRTSLLGNTEALRQLVERVCGVAVYGSRAS